MRTMAKGRIAELDTTLAEAAPGVLLVLTHRNMDRLEPLSFIFAGGEAQSSFMPLMSDEIRYAGQTIALVVAETQEAADDAAHRIEVAYRAEPAAASIDDEGAGAPVDAAEAIEIGDAEGAFAAAQVISPYVGGGFGSKATIMPHTVLLAAAARRLGRPVKLVVSREHMYTAGSFRPATTQRVALGAARDGRLLALIHEQSGQTSRMDQVCLPGTHMTARMYAA